MTDVRAWNETDKSGISRVSCGNCGTPIAEPAGLPVERRNACPTCGSSAREFFVSMSVTANVEAAVATEGVPTATLLLQTLIIPSVRTTEGMLIEAVALPWFDILDRLKADPAIAFQIPSRTWEELIAGAYKAAGLTR